MKKMIDLVADSGTGKDQKLINYIIKHFIKNNYLTKICFIYGQGTDYENHKQLSPSELRKLIFDDNDKNTIYFLASFFFDKDRDNYLKVMENACNSDIQIFKTDQVKEHVTSDESWTNKYCTFLTLDDLNK